MSSLPPRASDDELSVFVFDRIRCESPLVISSSFTSFFSLSSAEAYTFFDDTMERVFLLSVETDPDNVKLNPRTLGLCSGVNHQGMMYVRCCAVVMDMFHVMTTGVVLKWMTDRNAAHFFMFFDSNEEDRYQMTIDSIVSLDDEQHSVIILKPPKPIKATGDDNLCSPSPEGVDVCGTPFGCSRFQGCVFPACLKRMDHHRGIAQLSGIQLIDGMDGAAVVCRRTDRVCGIVLSARTQEAWFPRLPQVEMPKSVVAKPMSPNNKPLPCVVGLTGNNVWASGVVVAEQLDVNEVTVATCAHMFRFCKEVQVWQYGQCIGSSTAIETLDEMGLDIALLTVCIHHQDCKVEPCAVEKNLFQNQTRQVKTVGFHHGPPIHPYLTEPQSKFGVLVRSNTPIQLSTCFSEKGSSGGAVIDVLTNKVIGIQCSIIEGYNGNRLSLSCDIITILISMKKKT